MPKKMLIDATQPEETRVVVVDGKKVEDLDFESESRRQLAGNIYLAKVTRVEPSLQAAFVDYGGNRHGFLAFGEIHPDYYQIPIADREALLAEELADAEADAAEAAERDDRSARAAAERGRGDSTSSADPAGMEIVDAADEDGAAHREPVGEEAEAALDAPEQPAPEEAGASVDVDEIEHDAEAERTGRGARSASEEEREDDEEEVRPQRRRQTRQRRYKIQEVVKVRQIMLVQVVKEERGNKGAALTTYLSLAGRYCVLMPNTARGGGISRKITNVADRKKLKEIASEIEVPRGAGLIVRTAGAKRTKPEIKRDYEYLQRLWEQIRELTLKSIAPAKIYEEGDIIKRSIRDLYNREIEEVVVDGEAGYRTAKDFMKMIMPSHAKNVRAHTDPLPLFAKHQVESTLSAMFNPTVQLPSGGYIVIGITEALVAIDVNSGRSTREGSIEETALKTNLEAAEEVARQARLRDLAGLIVIDFIDMDERRNNAAVEKRLKEALKTDRARIQTGRISTFGLLEMSRQRMRPGMVELTTQPCPHCHGTGVVRSDDSLALSILRQIEEEGVRRRAREVLVRAPVLVVNYLFNNKREALAGIEARYGLSVRLEGDPAMTSPDFSVERFKTQTRKVEATAPVITGGTAIGEEDEDGNAWDDEPVGEEEASEDAPEAAADESDDGNGGRKKRRRRRRGRGRDEGGSDGKASDATDDDAAEESEERAASSGAPEDDEDGDGDGKPKRRRRSRGGRGRRRKSDAEEAQDVDGQEPGASVTERSDADEPKRPEVEATHPTAGGASVAEPAPGPEADSYAEPAPEALAEPGPSADLPPEAQATVAVAEGAPAQDEPEPVLEEAGSVPEEPSSERVAEALPESVEDDAGTVEAEGVSDAGVEPGRDARTPEEAEMADAAEGPSSEPSERPRRSGWWSRVRG